MTQWGLSAVERVLARIEKDPTGCWLFLGAINSDGYGSVREVGNGPTLKAHRVTFEHYRGEIPEGKELDHLCRVRRCVNPDHLDPVTRAEHVLRGQRNQNYGKLTCIRGHPLYGENVRLSSRGGRICKECNRLRLERNRRNRGILKLRQAEGGSPP